MPNKEAERGHYYAGIEKYLKNLSEFKLGVKLNEL